MGVDFLYYYAYNKSIKLKTVSTISQVRNQTVPVTNDINIDVPIQHTMTSGKNSLS